MTMTNDEIISRFLETHPDNRREEIADKLMDQLLEMQHTQAVLAKAMLDMSELLTKRFNSLQKQVDDLTPQPVVDCHNPNWKPGDLLP